MKHQILCVQTHACCVYVLDLCSTCFHVYAYLCGFVPVCLHHLCTFAPAVGACACANCIQPPLPHTTTTSTCYSHYHHMQQPLPHTGPGEPLWPLRPWPEQRFGTEAIFTIKSFLSAFAENFPLLVQQIKLFSVVSSVCSVLLIITSVTLLNTIVSNSTLYLDLCDLFNDVIQFLAFQWPERI